jgi:hypothetical protein
MKQIATFSKIVRVRVKRQKNPEPTPVVHVRVRHTPSENLEPPTVMNVKVRHPKEDKPIHTTARIIENGKRKPSCSKRALASKKSTQAHEQFNYSPIDRLDGVTPPAEINSCVEECARLGWEDVTGLFINDACLFDDLEDMLLLFKRYELDDWTFTRRVMLKPGRRYTWRELKGGDGVLQGIAIDVKVEHSKMGMNASSFRFYTSKPIRILLMQIEDIMNSIVAIREGLEEGLNNGLEEAE